MFEIQATVVR